jgi:RNA polymerase sigma factor (TIGR02999 family)
MSPRPQSPRRARQATDGAARSSAELLPEVYEELRRLARARLRRESHTLTLQPTALVHEAYLRLDAGAGRRWDGRGHFFAAAAIAMRRILVERARHRRRLKHGGEQSRVDIASEPAASAADPDDVLAVDYALDQLQRLDRRKAQVVMLRYFAGLTVEETAAALDLSTASVKTEWAFARAWLRHVLRRKGSLTEDGRA